MPCQFSYLFNFIFVCNYNKNYITEPFNHTTVDSKKETEKRPFHASTTISILKTYLKTTLNGANNSALILGYDSKTSKTLRNLFTSFSR